MSRLISIAARHWVIIDATMDNTRAVADPDLDDDAEQAVAAADRVRAAGWAAIRDRGDVDELGWPNGDVILQVTLVEADRDFVLDEIEHWKQVEVDLGKVEEAHTSESTAAAFAAAWEDGFES